VSGYTGANKGVSAVVSDSFTQWMPWLAVAFLVFIFLNIIYGEIMAQKENNAINKACAGVEWI
jgi:hypothetical protein